MIRLLALLCLIAPIFGATTTINCKVGQSTPFLNVPIDVAFTGTEQAVTITVTPGYPVSVMFVSNKTGVAQAWLYRATPGGSTNDQAVAASQTLVYQFWVTTSFAILQQSAGGTVTVTPLTYIISH